MIRKSICFDEAVAKKINEVRAREVKKGGRGSFNEVVNNALKDHFGLNKKETTTVEEEESIRQRKII